MPRAPQTPEVRLLACYRFGGVDLYLQSAWNGRRNEAGWECWFSECGLKEPTAADRIAWFRGLGVEVVEWREGGA